MDQGRGLHPCTLPCNLCIGLVDLRLLDLLGHSSARGPCPAFVSTQVPRAFNMKSVARKPLRDANTAACCQAPPPEPRRLREQPRYMWALVETSLNPNEASAGVRGSLVWVQTPRGTRRRAAGGARPTSRGGRADGHEAGLPNHECSAMPRAAPWTDLGKQSQSGTFMPKWIDEASSLHVERLGDDDVHGLLEENSARTAMKKHKWSIRLV